MCMRRQQEPPRAAVCGDAVFTPPAPHLLEGGSEISEAHSRTLLPTRGAPKVYITGMMPAAPGPL